MSRYLIKLFPSAAGETDALLERLTLGGLEIDADFGVICVDPEERVVVVRGEATEEVLEELSREIEMQAFPDLKIMPVGRGIIGENHE